MGLPNRVSWLSKLLPEKNPPTRRHRGLPDATLLSLLLLAVGGQAAAQSCVSLTGATYGQDFNTLASTGTAANTTLPIGWYML